MAFGSQASSVVTGDRNASVDVSVHGRQLSATVPNVTPPPTGARPNILWLIAEDTVKTNFGAYGNTSVKTPTIDRLATLGIRFDNAFSTAPHCSPARATLISGTHATVYGTDIHRMPVPVPTGQYFFPKLLRQRWLLHDEQLEDRLQRETSGHRSRASVECAGRYSYVQERCGASVLLCVHEFGVAHGPRHEVPARQAHGTAYRSEQRGAAAVRPGFASLA